MKHPTPPRYSARTTIMLVGLVCLFPAACAPAPRPGQQDPAGAPGDSATTRWIDIQGSLFWVRSDRSLKETGGGTVHLVSDGTELGATPIAPDGSFRIQARVPVGQLRLRFVQLGFDEQVRTVQVSDDLAVRTAPVCTAEAYGPPPEPYPLPALALLDHPTEPRCDYPLVDTGHPYDFRIRPDTMGG